MEPMYYTGLISPRLALLYDLEKQKGNANRATLAVARKLVAYLMAVLRGDAFPGARPRGLHSCLGRKQFFQREACQVLPLNRLGARAQAPDAPVDEFRDWQENTNSILVGSPT